MKLHPIPGRPGYHATVDGDIWSTRRIGRGNNEKYDAEPRLMKTYVEDYLDASRRTPYRRRLVRLGKTGGVQRVSRLVCLAFHGSPESPDLQVAHLNGDSLDNRPENLQWKTAAGNQADRVPHGTHNRGERQGSHTLTARQVAELRAEYAAGGVSQRELGRRYGVSQGHVSELVNRKKWAWLG